MEFALTKELFPPHFKILSYCIHVQHKCTLLWKPEESGLLELQMAESTELGARNLTLILWKIKKFYELLNHLSSPRLSASF